MMFPADNTRNCMVVTFCTVFFLLSLWKFSQPHRRLQEIVFAHVQQEVTIPSPSLNMGLSQNTSVLHSYTTNHTDSDSVSGKLQTTSQMEDNNVSKETRNSVSGPTQLTKLSKTESTQLTKVPKTESTQMTKAPKTESTQLTKVPKTEPTQITKVPKTEPTQMTKVSKPLRSSSHIENSISISGNISVSFESPRKNSKKAATAPRQHRVSTDKLTPRLLFVEFMGRLGNELFQYASTLGLSLTMNRTPVFFGSRILRNVLQNFTVTSANLSVSQLNERYKRSRELWEETCCIYSEYLTRLNPKYDYTIGNFLQSYKYFDKYATKIQEAVKFTANIQNQARKIVHRLRRKYPGRTLIGVHVRHGDMAYPRNRDLGYPVASPEYINRSLAYFSQRYTGCVFVVASDSLQWCRDNFPKGYTVHFVAGNEAAVDLLTLASMDHVIITFGTFSWWIGYLNRGSTVYMKDFIVEDSFLAEEFRPEGKDYIYPGWIPL